MTPADGSRGRNAAGDVKTAVLMPMKRRAVAAPEQAASPEHRPDTLWLGEMTTTDRLPDVHKDPALAVYETSRADRNDAGRRTRLALQRAHQAGMTHLITLPADHPNALDTLRRLRSAVQNAPDHLINGNRFGDGSPAAPQRDVRDHFARFWFRIQTGLSVEDPLCRVRAYPLGMIGALKLKRNTEVFFSEVLVKAAWAGVPIHETELACPCPLKKTAGIDRRRGLTALVNLAFNLHWTLRSITPIPHRKIATDTARTGRVLSVWHPIRSIKALLTENLSPKQLAAAAALGVFLGTLPLIACHSVAILFGANYFRLNKVAALTASQLCMPPVVPALCIEAGYYMRHGTFLTEVSLETLGYQALDRLLEWLLGSLLLAPLLAALAAGAVWVIAAGVAAKTESGDPGVRQ